MADTYRSFHDIVAGNARRWPDRTYVFCLDQEKGITYGELHRLSNRMAGFLGKRGFAANDRVLLLAENSVEFLAVFVGTLRFGATIATVHVEMNAAHMADIIGAVDPKLVLYQDGLGLEELREASPGKWLALGEWAEDGGSTGFFAAIAAFDADDDRESVAARDDFGVIFYTSGTVARPKGVIQTHGAAFYNYDSTADYLELGPGDRVLDCRSYSWLSAQHMSLGAPLVAGATTIMAQHFSHSRYFHWLRDYRVNIGFVVPTMVNMLVNRPLEIAGLPDLRFLTCSSAPLLDDQWRKFEDLYGITLAQSCGSSEGGNTAAHRGAARKIGTIGPAQKYQQINIEGGEIIVGGGKQQALGYLLPNGTIELLPADGHHTGDLGRLDGHGHLIITGRVKELIIRGGVNIAPLEIDAMLAGHPDVAEAGTVGVPDAVYGEEVVSYVILRPGAASGEDDLLAYCRDRLPEFKTPKRIFFRDAMPRNPRGKLDRPALAAEWKRTNQ